MKNKWLSILFTVLIFETAFTQAREMSQAIENGKINQYLYEAKFKRTQDKSEIDEWCLKNDFVLLSVKEGQLERFGKVMNGIVSARFATYSDYALLKEFERKNEISKADARSKNRGNEIVAAFAAVIGIGAILAGGYILNKELGSPNRSDYTYNANPERLSPKKVSDNLEVKEKAQDNYHCYSTIKEAFKSYVGCDSYRTMVYEVKCSDGLFKNYYYIPSDQSSGICQRPMGYYMGTGSILDFGQDYLGKNYEKALKKICNCNN